MSASRKERRGQVYVWLGIGLLFLFLLLALVIEVGRMINIRTKEQNAVDAAALAGAQHLPDAPAAKQEAAEYYIINHQLPKEDLEELETTGDTTHYRAGPGQVWVTTPYNGDELKIEVRSGWPISFLFGRLSGLMGNFIGARAVATLGAASCVDGRNQDPSPIVPWGVLLRDAQDFVSGQEYVIKQGPWGEEWGNFGVFVCSGRGGRAYLDDILHGCRRRLCVGDQLDLEPGNMAGPTREGVEGRLAEGHTLIIVPVVRVDFRAGRTDVTVTGFAAMRLTGVDWRPEGPTAQVRAIYLEPIIAGTSGGGTPGFFGNVRAVQLIE